MVVTQGENDVGTRSSLRAHNARVEDVCTGFVIEIERTLSIWFRCIICALTSRLPRQFTSRLISGKDTPKTTCACGCVTK